MVVSEQLSKSLLESPLKTYHLNRASFLRNYLQGILDGGGDKDEKI